MAHKLNWTVAKNKDGSIVRRRVDGDRLGLDYIDVAWTHTDGFPEDTRMVPVSHPPNERYEEQKCGARKVIQDQLAVPAATSDAVITMLLDERRPKLADSLKVSP